jgi:hypothetical protein
MTVTVDTATSRVLSTTDVNLVRAATSLIPTLSSQFGNGCSGSPPRLHNC